MSTSSHTWSLWRYFQLSHWWLCSPICCCCFLLCNQPLSQVTEETQTLPGYCSPVVWVPTWQWAQRAEFNPAAPPCIPLTVPTCSQQEPHCHSATQLLKRHRAFPLWQLVCTERRWKHGQIQWITLKRAQWNLLSKQVTQAVQPIRSEITEQLKWTNATGDVNTVLKQYKH